MSQSVAASVVGGDDHGTILIGSLGEDDIYSSEEEPWVAAMSHETIHIVLFESGLKKKKEQLSFDLYCFQQRKQHGGQLARDGLSSTDFYNGSVLTDEQKETKK